jgi:hypothetical protein
MDNGYEDERYPPVPTKRKTPWTIVLLAVILILSARNCTGGGGGGEQPSGRYGIVTLLS